MSLRAIRRSGRGGAVETGSLDTSSFVAYACGWVRRLRRGEKRPMMRAGACLGWRLRREAYCRFKGDRPRCATFPPAGQKEWFFTGLTSQICCIKGLVCQEPHVWVTESERTVSIMSAPHAFRLRKGTLCYEMSCTRMVDSEEAFKSSVQRQINKGIYCMWSKCSASQRLPILPNFILLLHSISATCLWQLNFYSL